LIELRIFGRVFPTIKIGVVKKESRANLEQIFIVFDKDLVTTLTLQERNQ
jgi:hypothetical protein